MHRYLLFIHPPDKPKKAQRSFLDEDSGVRWVSDDLTEIIKVAEGLSSKYRHAFIVDTWHGTPVSPFGTCVWSCTAVEMEAP